jgi:signal transduction histidine kinase
MLSLKAFILLAFSTFGTSPQEEIQTKQLSDTTGSIDSLLNKSEQSLYSQADSSFLYANRATDLCKELNDTSLLIKSLRAKAKAKKTLYQYKDAILIYENATILSEKIKDPLLIWQLKNDIGKVYSEKKDYINTLKFYIEALAIAENNNQKKLIAESNNKIAIILKNQKNYKEAINYLKKSLAIWRELKNSLNSTKTTINIAGNLAMLGKFNKSLDYLFQAENYVNEIKNTKLLSDIMISIANIYSFKSDIPKAEIYYLKAIKLKKTLSDKRGLAITYNNIGIFYLKHANYPKGEKYTKLALSHAQRLNLRKIEMSSCKGLSFIYSKQKKFESAYGFQTRFVQLKDSLYNIQKTKQLAEIRTKYEAEKKEQQIKILENENQLNQIEIKSRKLERNSLAAGIVIVILSFFFILRAYWEKKKVNVLLKDRNELIEQHKANLSKQNRELNRVNSTKDRLFSIIAHDLRSPMSSMEGLSGIIRRLLISGKIEKLDAVAQHIDQTVNRLNALLDNLLNWSLSQINGIKVNKEEIYLKNIILYSADIQRPALDAKQIALNIDIDESIRVYSDQNMLRTIIRNLINNAIKFTPSGGNILISASTKDKQVQISVKDSGIGIPPEKLDSIFEMSGTKISADTDGEKGTGLGLSLCRDFITLNKGDIKISSEMGKGTKVLLSLPYLN